MLNKNVRTQNPSYFDYSWNELTLKLDIDSSSSLILQSEEHPNRAFLNIMENEYDGFSRIYTDRSHDPISSRSSSSFVIPEIDYCFKVRLNGLTPIYTCELYAIYSALKQLERMGLKKFVIITDSRKALEELPIKNLQYDPSPIDS